MRPYIILLAAAVTFSASALQIGDFFQNAEVIKANSVKIVNESLIKVSATIKGYAANAPYAIKTVDVPKPTFMSHVKTNMKGLVKKNAWYAAWFATMAAAGWAIDELTGQVTRPLIKTNYYGQSGSWANPFNLSPVVKDLQTAIASQIAECSRIYSSYPPCTSDGVLLPRTPPLYYYKIKFKGGVSTREIDFKVLSQEDVVVSNEPVSDDSLYDSLATEMLKDPYAAAQAFMVPDAWPYPYPHIFPDPVKYIPGVSETDEELLDALIKGQLQTTNPNAANYVTPEKLQQLQQLLAQLQQGITPEGQVGAANDKLKDPLTQAQLEETMKKEKEAEA
ncbi:hypothetical protein, partial [Aeromonas allosaccharophila]